jgi:hypothetical protein
LTRHRPAVAAAAALALLLAGACAARRAGTEAEGASFGIYRGRYTAPGGTDVRFKAWIFAAPPDRLHAELLGPAGGAHWIVDGGNGRLAVTSVDEGTCYAGAATPEAVEAALGVHASLAGLVAAFLGTPADSTLPGAVRAPAGPGLPERFEVASEGRVLALAKQSERQRPSGSGSIGTGEAPAGVGVRPLAELSSGPWRSASTERAEQDGR